MKIPDPQQRKDFGVEQCSQDM